MYNLNVIIDTQNMLKKIKVYKLQNRERESFNASFQRYIFLIPYLQLVVVVTRSQVWESKYSWSATNRLIHSYKNKTIFIRWVWPSSGPL